MTPILEELKPGVKKAVIPKTIIAVMSLPINWANLCVFIKTSFRANYNLL